MTTSPLANPTATRELLEEFGLATKHRLGQNFLIDNHVIERICELSELTGDERVLEVGPGVGTLTLALLQEAACVTSIEADPELEPVLDAHAADYANFRFIMGDALKVTTGQIEQAAGGEPTVFVANLPYNVAATIILQFFQTMPALKRAVVMVQRRLPIALPRCRVTRPMAATRQSSACMRRLRVALRCRHVALCRHRTWTRPSCVSTVLTAWRPKDSIASLWPA